MLKLQRDRTDRDGGKGRKQPDTEGQIRYHSIYRLVPSEVTQLRAGAKDGGGGAWTGGSGGNSAKVVAAPGVTPVKYSEPHGVTAPDCWLTPVISAS